MVSYNKLEETITKNFDDKLVFYKNNKYLGILVSIQKVYKLIKLLKEYKPLSFIQLIDITAIDYPSRETRFDIIYILLSLTLNKRILVKSSIMENQNIDSISSISGVGFACFRFPFFFSAFANSKRALYWFSSLSLRR